MFINQQLADKMVEGLIFINHKGDVQHYNKAAEFCLPLYLTAKPTMRRLIAEEIIGQTQLPVSADFFLGSEASGITGPKAWLSKNGHLEYLLMITHSCTPAIEKIAIENKDVTGHYYAMLMGEEIRVKLKAFQEIVRLTSLSRELAAVALQIESLLGEVASLSMLVQRDQVFSSERIDINAVLQGCINFIALEDERVGTHDLELDISPPGMIYGDVKWLTYAFEVLLLGLVRGMAPRSRLHITVRQVGDFVMVAGRNIYAKALQVPLDAKNSTVDPREGRTSKDPVHISARTMMAQRVLELHSGYLKLNFLPGNDLISHPLAEPIESFSVTLLTGLPQHERSRASCTKCPFSAQALVYAKEIAELLESVS